MKPPLSPPHTHMSEVCCYCGKGLRLVDCSILTCTAKFHVRCISACVEGRRTKITLECTECSGDSAQKVKGTYTVRKNVVVIHTVYWFYIHVHYPVFNWQWFEASVHTCTMKRSTIIMYRMFSSFTMWPHLHNSVHLYNHLSTFISFNTSLNRYFYSYIARKPHPYWCAGGGKAKRKRTPKDCACGTVITNGGKACKTCLRKECSLKQCNLKAYSQGVCKNHNPTHRMVNGTNICINIGCTKTQRTYGRCEKHSKPQKELERKRRRIEERQKRVEQYNIKYVLHLRLKRNLLVYICST